MADDVDPRAGELTTANYGWTKPTVGASDDAWGGYLNTDLDGIDTTVKGVSTVANAAYPASNPAGYITAAAIPAPYVLPTASTSVLGGVKVDGTTVAISGGGVISAAGAVAVSATAPSSPVAGSLWFDTNGGQMYVWYDDGNSQQWVPVVNQGSVTSSVPLIVPPPAAVNWTQRNFGGSTTLTNVTNGVRLFDASVAGVANNMRGITLVSPATPYTVDLNISGIGLIVSGGELDIGVGWFDGVKIQTLRTVVAATSSTNAAQFVTAIGPYSSYTASGANVATYWGTRNASDLWVRVADNGTTVSWLISADGISYISVYSVAKAAGYLGSGGYSNIGVFIDGGVLGNGGSGSLTLRSWLVH